MSRQITTDAEILTGHVYRAVFITGEGSDCHCDECDCGCCEYALQGPGDYLIIRLDPDGQRVRAGDVAVVYDLITAGGDEQ